MDAAAELPALRADPPTTAQPDRHDHAFGAEADVDHHRPRQAQKAVECRGDAHVVLLTGRLTLNSQQPAPEDGGASITFCATSARISLSEVPAHAANTARPSPPNNEETRKNARTAGG
jgi:hypothetical protein